jgi:DNA-directed RNA polymerase specialized sigma subunit
MQSIKTMTSKDLEAEFGRCITDVELAKYINVDVRTLRKYAAWLGGVMVMPGKYRFFENLIKEKLKNAEPNHEKRCPSVSSERSSTRGIWEKETKALSERQQKIVQKRSIMGGKNKETVKGGNGARSRHGVF